LRLDSVLLGILLVLTLIMTIRAVRWHAMPTEDALMLMRYATNFAHGDGITWNPGDAPVEGATDFLYLVAVTLWMKISSLDAIMAARTLSTVAHVMCVALLYLSGRRLFGQPPGVVAILALYMATGPGVWNTSDGFSGAFYAFFAMAAWYCACKIVVDGPTRGHAVAYASLALVTGLVRPDGVFLALFMTAALVYALRGRSKQVVLLTSAIFLVLGGIYFAWRWHYFGHLLPNPFYRKGGGHLHWDSFKKSNQNTFRMLFPVIPLFAVGLFAKRTRQTVVFACIPIVAFTWIWILLSNENNADMRFQYVTFCIGLMSVPMILGAATGHLRSANWSSLIPVKAWIIVLICVVPMSLQWWKLLLPNIEPGSGEYDISVGLAKWKYRNYTLTTTEAGVIPYFSTWRSIDSYGLNDAEIVHNPEGLTEAYLEKNHPALLIFHLAPDGNNQAEQAAFESAWKAETPQHKDLSHQPQVTSHYAVTHNYTLAARWGDSPCDLLIYYVRNDLPEYSEMLALIRKAPHFFQPNGLLSVNYLGAEPPHVCAEKPIFLKP
jgi:arabinofuranosyltransferase